MKFKVHEVISLNKLDRSLRPPELKPRVGTPSFLRHNSVGIECLAIADP